MQGLVGTGIENRRLVKNLVTLAWKCSRCDSVMLPTTLAESTCLSAGQIILSETGNSSIGLSIREASTEVWEITGEGLILRFLLY